MTISSTNPNDQRWENWINHYLHEPGDEHAVDGAVGIATSITRNPGAKSGSVLAVGAFIAQIWTAHMALAPSFFLEALDKVPEGKPGARPRSVIYLMAALCPIVASKLDEVEAIDEEDTKDLAGAKQIRELFNDGRDLHQIEISQPWHLDLLWGAFMGSGDMKYVHAVLQCVHWVDPKHRKDKRAIAGAAIWSLSSNRSGNPFVAAAIDSLFVLDPKLEQTYERSFAIWS